MVPSARNVEITARPCSFAPSWAASSRVVMCSPFVPCLRLKGSSFWLTLRKGHDLIAVLTTGSLRSYCPVSDPLRTPVDRGEPIPQSGRRPSRPCHARDPPLLPTCITMHRRSPAKLPALPHFARCHLRLTCCRVHGDVATCLVTQQSRE